MAAKIRCPLCRCPAPAHEFGCWALLSPEPARIYAADAPVVAANDVFFAQDFEASELRRIAAKTKDPATKRALQERARAHENRG